MKKIGREKRNKSRSGKSNVELGRQEGTVCVFVQTMTFLDAPLLFPLLLGRQKKAVHEWYGDFSFLIPVGGDSFVHGGHLGSDFSFPAKKKKKAETPAEQKARLKKEGEAYDRRIAKEDKMIAKGLAYRGRKP